MAPVARRVAEPPRTHYEKYRRRKRGGRLRTCFALVAFALVVAYTMFALAAILSFGDDEPLVEEEQLKAELELELDPHTGLLLPRFWEPPASVADDLESYYEKDANGEATIWVMIASYRDFQCRETIASALERATFPGRLRIAAVQQNSAGDVGCAEPLKPCAEDPTHVLCSRRDQIHVFELDADEATGPVFARHVGYRMYRGEAFAMQVDAHVLFVNGWDTKFEAQWKSAKNEMAVLSTYLTDVKGSLDAAGDSTRNTRPIMCNSDFEGSAPARYLRHGAQPEEAPVIHGEPMMQPFWAAGMSFARGHFVHRVPYDCCLPMVFMGEEISLGIRAWTHGYDLYTPEASVVFHEYAVQSERRRHVHLFWENSRKASVRADSSARSLKRLTALIGMAPDVQEAGDFDHAESDRYGLGAKRPVDLFYKLFLIDVHKRLAKPLCKFIKTGVMHNDFSAHMRPDGRGVDYSQLEDYDTAAAIEKELETNWRPQARRGLHKAMEINEKGWLNNAIDQARRAEFNKGPPDDQALLQQATRALAALK